MTGRIDLVNSIVDGVSGVSRAEATAALRVLTAGIAASLVEGEQVTISGFGVFWVAERPARRGRCPSRGTSIQVGPRRLVCFRAAAALKKTVNEGRRR